MATQAFDPMAKSRAAVEAAKADTTGKVYRVYCDGIFDLFHLGHMRMLEQAKKALGDPAKVWLIAGVCDDEMTQKFKGKVVMNHKLRCDSVSHCKWVDEVAPDAPWVIDDAFLQKYKIDFVAHDALPYKDSSGASGDGDVYSFVRAQGKFLETQRTDGISTSDLIVAIVRDYDEYVRRNLDRGYTKEQLNVGRSWEFRANLHERQKKVQQAVDAAKNEYRDFSKSLRSFVRRFGANAPKEGTDFHYAPAPTEEKERDDSGSGSDSDTGSAKSRWDRNGEEATLEEVAHQGYGLCRAVLFAAGWVIGALNPFAYCPRRKTKTK